MRIDCKIWDEKLQYNTNREVAKISTLSSSKSNKCEYLTGKEILPPNQSRVIEPAKFTYSCFARASEKELRTTEDQEKKMTP